MGAMKRQQQEQKKNPVALCVSLTNFFSLTLNSMSDKCSSSASQEEHMASTVQVAVVNMQVSKRERRGGWCCFQVWCVAT